MKNYEYRTSDQAFAKFRSVLEPFSGNYGRNTIEKPAIVIDNGSYETRAGWSFAPDSPYLRSQSISSKPKNFSGSGSLTKTMCDMILVGNELLDYDMNRENVKKSMFDKNVIYQ